MGGINQSTCNPPKGTSINPIRIHENIDKKEIHFHDDLAGLKFSMPKPDFDFEFLAAEKTDFASPLVLKGNDGRGNPMKATITKVSNPPSDDDLSIIVEKVRQVGTNWSNIRKVIGI